MGISFLSSNDLFGALSYFSKRHSAKVFLVFLMVSMVGGQKWAQHSYFSRWSVWVEITLHYSKSVLPTSMIGPVLREESWCHIQSLSLAYGGGIGVSEWFQPLTRVFLEMFTQIWSLSGLAMIHKPACSHYSKRQTFPFMPGVCKGTSHTWLWSPC